MFSSALNLFLKKGPIYLILFVTARCNLKCKMCFYWKESSKANQKLELDLDEIRMFSSKLGKILQLSLAGGEPTIREDLPEICKIFERNNKVLFITLPTNGLQTEKVIYQVEKIVVSCKKIHLRVAISLDGPQEIHDNIRGIEGTFKKALDTYFQLKKLSTIYKNLSVDVASVLQLDNQHYMKDFFFWVDRYLIPDNHVLMISRGNLKDNSLKNVDPLLYQELIKLKKEQLYNGKENRPFSSLIRAITLQSMETILKEFLSNQYQIPCVAGKKLLVITEKADVKLCEILGHSLGNLRDYKYDLEAILQEHKNKCLIQSVVKDKCHCTFECAVNISTIYDWRNYLDLFKTMCGL